MDHTEDLVHFGTSLGRGQAFGAMANHCAAAQAQALQQIWESESYKLLDLTWEEFCVRMVGLSRQRVEGIIRNLKEFGTTYLQLSEIVAISPENYRRLLPVIRNSQIEIDGELIPIKPENCARIRAGILKLRGDLRKANEEARLAVEDLDRLTAPDVAGLQVRFDAWLDDLVRHTPDAAVRGLVAHSLRRLHQLEDGLASRQ